MSDIHIQGLRWLKGDVEIQGSKNAVLPVMAASLLHKGIVRISNVPRIQDVFCMLQILTLLGCACWFQGNELVIDAEHASAARIPDVCCKQMRSSIMLLGPMLGRFREAVVTHPGGCSIGKRPVDLHIRALECMGAEIRTEGEEILAQAPRLEGSGIVLSFPSVGATENALMAAAAAEGVTRISNAAMEPEIVVVCEFLKALGAGIQGIGSPELTVCGRKESHGQVDFAVPGDRIVAGTYLGAVLGAGGQVTMNHVPTDQLGQVLALARAAGGKIQAEGDCLRVRQDQGARPFSLCTGPYPRFPTDLQSVMLAVASVADGRSQIRETIFEERFATAKELQKMGAHIIIEDNTAYVTGRSRLYGCPVRAGDLRGGAALVVAALAAEGETRIGGYSYIQRGYEDICRDLSGLGASISLEG
ncbi:MAG: UDP-N-acetylglucosamine 1-carboxyvinyltransferase [Lachnospiraceae bacterium]|nr:UDP-N-acetylglucosamine 1-carboxyvinyltransferase [Lachnospiraceae bacterium]